MAGYSLGQVIDNTGATGGFTRTPLPLGPYEEYDPGGRVQGPLPGSTYLKAPTRKTVDNRPSMGLDALLAMFGQANGGSGSGGPGAGNWAAIPREVAPTEADRTAGNQAALARAKDQQANLAKGALKGLASRASATGRAGTNFELSKISDIAEQGQGQVGDLVNRQAMADVDAGERIRQNAFSGNITQRGQDLNQQQAQNQWQTQWRNSLLGYLAPLFSSGQVRLY